MTKVISFCLWGEDPKYCVGAIRNAQLAIELFPDWECWFYMNMDEFAQNGPWIDHLIDAGEHVKIKLTKDAPGWRMMLNRFQAIEDPLVDVMISRDCDSRLSVREKTAVDEWLESDKMFHTMHDHPWHTVPILGGCWGIKKGLFSELGRHAMEWAKKHESRWQIDQDFLTEVVWPTVKNDALNHDEFFRHLWGGKPFPSPRSGLEFMGQVFDENEITVAEHAQALKQAL